MLALNVLEGFDLAEMDPLSPERWHRLIEALRLAFADTRWYVADPQVVTVPTTGLLSKTYAAERRAIVNHSKRACGEKRVRQRVRAPGHVIGVPMRRWDEQALQSAFESKTKTGQSATVADPPPVCVKPPPCFAEVGG